VATVPRDVPGPSVRVPPWASTSARARVSPSPAPGTPLCWVALAIEVSGVRSSWPTSAM
jgi:hypothetical protein